MQTLYRLFLALIGNIGIFVVTIQMLDQLSDSSPCSKTPIDRNTSFQEGISKILATPRVSRGSSGYEREFDASVEFREGLQNVLTKIFRRLRYNFAKPFLK